jgi:protein involved in polysaccharide export with SLBB domain
MKLLSSPVKTWGLVMPGLATLLMLAACKTSDYTFPDAVGTNGVSASSVVATNSIEAALSSDRLVPGNKITITFSGNPSPPPKHEERVREDGYVSPPLLVKPVMAAGKTVGQLQEELRSLYVPAYFKSLTVTVSTDERVVFVGGQVKNPGPHLYMTGMTVLKAIQAAGDFTEFGNPRNVTVTRANGRQETVNCSKALVDPKYDKLVYPDDRIQVKRRVIW